MQFLLALSIAAVAAVHTFASIKRPDPVLVRAVIDGDTIDVTPVGRVRLLGIDAPQIGRGLDTAAPFGRQARARLSALILNRWVRLEQEGTDLDAYARHLAYVLTEDGVFVNAAIVRDGLARVSARAPLARLSELKRAEREAQAFRRGMWGQTPSIGPESYRTKPPRVAPRTPRRYTARAKTPPTSQSQPREKRRPREKP